MTDRLEELREAYETAKTRWLAADAECVRAANAVVDAQITGRRRPLRAAEDAYAAARVAYTQALTALEAAEKETHSE